MGIVIGSKLLVGSTYLEMSHILDPEEYFLVQIDGLGMEIASPWLDADRENFFVGYPLPNRYAPDDSWCKLVKEKAEQFEKVTGVKAVIFGGANVW